MWQEARRLCPQGVSGAVLLLRPLLSAASPPEPHMALAPLAAMVRALVRRSDRVLVDDGHSIGVVLVDTDATGARVVARRLRAALATLTAPPDPGGTASPSPARLGIGYSALPPPRPITRWHAEGAVRAAWKPQLFVTASWLTEGPTLHTAYASDRALEGACLRVIRTGGQREGERQPLSAARPAPAIAVGAPVPPLDDTPEEAMASQLRVLTFATSPARHDRLRVRALAMGVPFLHLPPHLPLACRDALTTDLAHELRAVPVGRTSTALTVALDARWDARVLFRLRTATGLDIFPVLTLPDELDRALYQLHD